jgi:hypothetical protein
VDELRSEKKIQVFVPTVQLSSICWNQAFFLAKLYIRKPKFYFILF